MSIKQLKLFPLIVVLVVIFLQYRLWFEPDGILDMIHLKKQVTLQSIENDKLKKRNEALLTQIQTLQKNEDAVESRARHELGMIKKDETFYQVVK